MHSLQSPNVKNFTRKENCKSRVLVNLSPVLHFSGKRICLGEALAKTELFIVFIRLMQKLEFSMSKNHPKPTDKPVKGFISAPEPFHVVATLRS